MPVRGIVLLLPLLAVLCWPARASEDRNLLFARALESARLQQWPMLEELEPQLGADHPLQGYLDFHRIRARLDQAPVEDVLAYLRRYDDSPLAASLRRLALEEFARRQRWQDLQAVSAGVPSLLPLRCHYYRAMLTSEPERARAAARELWLSGQSRPDACDPLFDALRQAGELDPTLIWQRLLLAARAGNDGLMRYIGSLLSEPDWQARRDQLLALYAHPARVRYLQPGPHHDDIATVILERLAGQQPDEARRVLPMLARRLALDPARQAPVKHRIAWFSVIRDVPENRDWLDDYLQHDADTSLLEQRIRRAVMEQDWPAVSHWIGQLPATEQQNPRWHYWQGRAMAQQGHEDEARRHYQQAATQRSFWGFLAADRLDQAPALNLQPPVVPAGEPGERSQRVLARVETLLAIGESGHAREEWLFLLRHLDDDAELDRLAAIARQRGWSHLAIETALHGGRHDVLDWRFPADREALFRDTAARHGTDPWLLMAVARRESAFNPQARSAAGALGLMQLLPGTARDMARASGQPLEMAQQLFDPATNVELGSRYLAHLLDRYGGNRVLALAAYNAGPSRVDRWLDESNAPFDVFIESIPFHETREYVQAVLAYRVIFSRHGPDNRLVALLGERETGRPYSPVLLAAGDP